MTEIILLSRRQDEVRVRPTVEALHGHGLDFWWEQEVGSLNRPRCAIILWTKNSVSDEEFIATAATLVAEDRAIAGMLEKVKVPASALPPTVIDLTRFKGRKTDLFLLDLLAAAKAKAAGIDPPPARGPIGRLVQRLSLAVPAVLVALGLLANITGAISVKDLLRFPSAQDSRAWKALRPGSCEDLRAYRTRFPDGYYFDKATALLTNPEQRSQVSTSTGVVPLKVYAPAMSATAALDRAAAEADALARARRQAESDCRRHAAINGDTFQAADLQAEAASCSKLADGYACSLAADVTCKMAVRVVTTVEVCATP